MSRLDRFGRIGSQVRAEDIEAAGSIRTVLKDGRVQVVSVRNPLAINSFNVPVEIRISFLPGECVTPGFLRVYDSVGQEVPCEWRFTEDPATWERIDALWPDGSVRRGMLRIVADLGPREVREYRVIVAAAPANYAQRTLYGEESAGLWYTESPQLRNRFAQSQGWMPRYPRDPSRALADYASTGTGLHSRLTLAGVNKFSYNAADVTALSAQRIGATDPGNGVVSQQLETKFAWADAPGTSVRTRFTHFSNNLVRYLQRWEVSADIASGNHGMSLYHNIANASAPTATYNATSGWAGYAYPNGASLCTAMSVIQQESDALRLNGSAPFDYTAQYDCAGNVVRLGWSKNPIAIPAGSYFTFGGFFVAGYDSLDNAALRGHNPIIARANGASRESILQSIRYSCRRLISAWTAIGLSDPSKAYWGSVALGWLVLAEDEARPAPVMDALNVFRRWCVEYGINPADASSWHAKWNHATSQLGLEFIGPASGCLPIMREMALKQGMSSAASTITTYLHAMADFAVQAEITSGGSGQIKLRFTDGDNFNAEASALLFLARSLAIEANATRQATLERIAARFVQGYSNGNKMGYSFQASPGSLRQTVQHMRASYHFYNVAVALHAHSIYPCLPAVLDARQFALEYSNGVQLDERTWSKQLERRGIVGNWIAAAYTLCMAPGRTDGDLRAAADYLDFVSARAGIQNPGTGILMDGYVYPDSDGGYGLWGGPESASLHMHLLHTINVGALS